MRPEQFLVQGMTYEKQGNYQKALSAYVEGVMAAESHMSDKKEFLFSLQCMINSGHVCLVLKRVKDAIALLEPAASIVDQVRLPAVQAQCYWTLGHALTADDRASEALAYLEKAVESSSNITNAHIRHNLQHLISLDLSLLATNWQVGGIKKDVGKGNVVDLSKRAALLASKVGKFDSICITTMTQAKLLRESGESNLEEMIDTLKQLLMQAMTTNPSADDLKNSFLLRLSLAETLRYSGRYGEASEMYREASVLSKGANDPSQRTVSLLGYGQALWSEGKWEEAIKQLDFAIIEAEKARNLLLLFEGCNLIGHYMVEAGMISHARLYYVRMATVAERLKDKAKQFEAYVGVAGAAMADDLGLARFYISKAGKLLAFAVDQDLKDRYLLVSKFAEEAESEFDERSARGSRDSSDDIVSGLESGPSEPQGLARLLFSLHRAQKLNSQGRSSEAAELFEQTLRGMESRIDEKNRVHSKSWIERHLLERCRGELAMIRGRWAEAIEAYTNGFLAKTSFLLMNKWPTGVDFWRRGDESIRSFLISAENLWKETRDESVLLRGARFFDLSKCFTILSGLHHRVRFLGKHKIHYSNKWHSCAKIETLFDSAPTAKDSPRTHNRGVTTFRGDDEGSAISSSPRANVQYSRSVAKKTVNYLNLWFKHQLTKILFRMGPYWPYIKTREPVYHSAGGDSDLENLIISSLRENASVTLGQDAVVLLFMVEGVDLVVLPIRGTSTGIPRLLHSNDGYIIYKGIVAALELDRQWMEGCLQAARRDLQSIHHLGGFCERLYSVLRIDELLRLIEVDPVKRKQIHLTIIPDGPLFRLPLHACRSREGGSLLDEFASIKYALSLSIMQRQEASASDEEYRRNSSEPLRGVAFASPNRKLHRRLPHLPGVRAEMSCLVEESGCGKWWIHGDAGSPVGQSTVVNFLARHGSGNILWYSGHGGIMELTVSVAEGIEVKDYQPAFLLNDGLIGTSELVTGSFDFSKQLLVNFASCFLGKLYNLDVSSKEVIGLLAALTACGARRISGSMWQIPDEAAVDFSRCWIRVINENIFDNNKGSRCAFSAAFQEAIRHFRELDNGKYNNEFYWASYVLYGAS